MCDVHPNDYRNAREVIAMHPREIIEGLLLVVIFGSAALLLPDFVRYMKMRYAKIRFM
jgi:hypothetical protein